MSEIDNTIYSAHTVKILEETGMNTEELTAYLERLRTKMQNKLDNLRTEVDNFVSQVSKTVFGRIRNFYNVDNEHTRRVNTIVNCCSSVLSKFNTALCEYVRKVQSPSVDNPEFSDLGMDIADEKFLFGGGLDFGSPFGVFESLENIPWDKNMK
ncbi:hypothetical protein AWRI1499_3707 [Brettanomyces bruxellensis AWRI1499]|nr:hypothetical protein AWRI1499_3707 [Brettanomyces bruxellensis AWRI1499]